MAFVYKTRLGTGHLVQPYVHVSFLLRTAYHILVFQTVADSVHEESKAVFWTPLWEAQVP